jgi:hypothetical protein
MTDRELLEAAAKAAGLEYRDDLWDGGHARNADGLWVAWRPLTDDGDALRLAVRLRLDICPFPDGAHVFQHEWRDEYCIRCSVDVAESWGADRAAATRRAIVRAAAEIGAAK